MILSDRALEFGRLESRLEKEWAGLEYLISRLIA
jgi:hypothetical protein